MFAVLNLASQPATAAAASNVTIHPFTQFIVMTVLPSRFIDALRWLCTGAGCLWID